MEYKVRKNLSSYQFYDMLGDIHHLLEENVSDKIVLDFTEVQVINALVIPNLILLGKYIGDRTGNKPSIRLGEDFQAGRLKRYLHDVNFYSISTRFFVYENGDDGKYGGMDGADMSSINTTQYFSVQGERGKVEEEKIKQIYFDLLAFTRRYRKQYDMGHIKNMAALGNEIFEDNIMTNLIREMIYNCFYHAESDVVITAQVNYKMKKILLAISDQGKGFLKSFLEKTSMPDEDYNVLKKAPENELEAIYTAIYKRKDVKVYGLYNMIRAILEHGGTVRIHSNNVRLVLTSRFLFELTNESLINSLNLNKYNIMETYEWPGVHLEIELPL